MPSDLSVQYHSDALQDKKIDLVVTGSIAAVESVRLIRALRRLRAEVRVVLSPGGKKFITPLALEWASNHEVQTDFAGKTSHLGEADALVVAPASANFVAMAAEGRTDHPGLALFSSYIGQKKPVLLLPCMHQSLEDSPIYEEQLEKITKYCTLLSPREEEGKRKFPDPVAAADEIAHLIRRENHAKPILVTLGSTKGYLDDVRYISNYSSGRLGSLLSEEFYRRGFDVHAVCGSSTFKPSTYVQSYNAETNSEMLDAVQTAVKKHPPVAALFCASVLDYVPEQRQKGKMRSGHNEVQVNFVPTPKIIKEVALENSITVGFKLEPEVNEESARLLAEKYGKAYALDLLVINELAKVSSHHHAAILAECGSKEAFPEVKGKKEVVDAIVDFVETRMQNRRKT